MPAKAPHASQTPRQQGAEKRGEGAMQPSLHCTRKGFSTSTTLNRRRVAADLAESRPNELLDFLTIYNQQFRKPFAFLRIGSVAKFSTLGGGYRRGWIGLT